MGHFTLDSILWSQIQTPFLILESKERRNCDKVDIENVLYRTGSLNYSALRSIEAAKCNGSVISHLYTDGPVRDGFDIYIEIKIKTSIFKLKLKCSYYMSRILTNVLQILHRYRNSIFHSYYFNR